MLTGLFQALYIFIVKENMVKLFQTAVTSMTLLFVPYDGTHAKDTANNNSGKQRILNFRVYYQNFILRIYL